MSKPYYHYRKMQSLPSRATMLRSNASPASSNIPYKYCAKYETNKKRNEIFSLKSAD